MTFPSKDSTGTPFKNQKCRDLFDLKDLAAPASGETGPGKIFTLKIGDKSG